MVDVLVLAAFALLVLGVVGSVLPALPGALLSLTGVLLYWWASGYSEPGTLLLAVLVVVAILAFLVDVLAGVFAAKVGGASNLSALLAGGVGLLALLVTGPLGMIVAVAGTVFVVEMVRGGDLRSGGRAAAITVVGVLGSAIVQAILTASILLAMVFVAVF